MYDKEKVKITVQLDKNIKEKLEKYKIYGFETSKIITMGIILLEDSQNFETLLGNKIMEDQTVEEIIELKERIDQLNKKLDQKIYKTPQAKLDKVIQWIYEEELLPREQFIEYSKEEIDPIGLEFFEEKSEITGIPAEEIINGLINTYTEEYLKDLNIDINKRYEK